MKIYLFGRHDSEIGTLINDPGFHDLAANLLQTEEAPAPAGAAVLVQRAEQSELLRSNGRHVSVGRRLVVCPADAEHRLADFWSPYLARYVEITRSILPLLQQAYSTTQPSRRFGWPQVEHVLVAGCFLDLAMGRVVDRSGQIDYEQGDTVVWAFERVSAGNAFGVQKSGLPDGFFAQLWHSTVKRDTLHLPESTTRTLVALASGEEGPSPKDALYLRYLGLLRQGALQIPAFLEEDTDRLLSILMPGARDLVSEAISPALDSLRNRGWWSERHAQPSYRHAAVRLLLEYGIDRVVEAGLVDPFPVGERSSSGWGRWLWKESSNQPGLVVS